MHRKMYTTQYDKTLRVKCIEKDIFKQINMIPTDFFIIKSYNWTNQSQSKFQCVRQRGYNG